MFHDFLAHQRNVEHKGMGGRNFHRQDLRRSSLASAVVGQAMGKKIGELVLNSFVKPLR
jgi:hypothetical protein